MNKVQTVRNNGTASTSFASGIRANLATTGTHSLRVYNNFVADITSAYTGAATATRIVKGIYVQSAGSGVSTESINVDANNVRIDGTLFPNSSNACFEIGTASGPVINVRNNVFANYTGAQAGVATPAHQSARARRPGQRQWWARAARLVHGILPVHRRVPQPQPH